MTGIQTLSERAASEQMTPSPETIRARASELAFGKPIVQNNLRGLVVEVIVEQALSPRWRL
jgi:hypothetical protein